MKRHVFVILLTLALLGVLAFSVSAAPSTDPAELNKVNEAAAQMTTDNVFGTSGGNVTGVLCPYCNETATWKPLPAATSTTPTITGHYYVAADLTANTTHYYASGKVCVHLNGKNITSTHSGATFSSPTGAQLNIMGNGNVSGKSTSTLGVVHLGGGTIRLFGGTYTRTTSKAYTVRVYAANSVFEMYAGTTVNGYEVNDYAAVYNGYSSAVLKMYGGTVNAKLGTAVLLKAGQFHQHGGTITNAKRSNIIVDGGAYTLHNGTITAGNAMISGYAIGGNVLLKSGSFTMEGGTISNGVAFESGANVYITDGTFTMKGGEICGGTLYSANTSRVGGAGIYIAGGTFDMQGGRVHTNAATGVSGGNFYIAGGELKLNTGTPAIQNGTASNGGNIYMAAGTVTMDGGTISGGEATTAGGSVYVYSGELNVNGGTITGGKAPNGGNVYLYAGDLTLDGGTITKGTASIDVNAKQWYFNGGGNIYVGDSAAAEAYIVSGTVSDGTSTNNGGGNILCRGNGTLTVSGGTISGGKSGYPGANIMNAASANVTISGGTVFGGNGNTRNRLAWDGDNVCAFGGTTTVSGGTIESDGKLQGNGVLAFYNAKIVLDGDATITTTGKAGNIYIAKQSGTATLQVNSTFTGEAGVSFDAEHGAALGAILTLDSSTGAYTGTLYAEDLDGAAIFATTDNKLQIAGVKLNDAWYQNNDTAVAAADSDDVIKLYTADDLQLQGAAYLVDLNGQSPTITGTGSVTCFDSANLDFVTFGTATVDGPTLVNTESTTQNGKLYYTLSEGKTHSFHVLEANVSSVSVRPASAGVYYGCAWNCDSTLLELLDIDSYGVALSLVQMPTADFTEEHHTLYTKVNGAFEPGNKRNSVLVNNVLKTTGNENQARAEMDIFAIPYVMVDGEIFMGTGVQYSFKDVVGLMDREDLYFANREALENFYDRWNSVLESWDLSFIGQYPMDPSEDGVLRFFLMGNSFTYYYVEELYTLLAEAGYENAEIYNLYHSGSGVLDHVTWWENNEAEYEFYLTTRGEDGKYKRAYVNPDKKWWTLDEALVTANWDYIGIQPSTTGLDIGFASAIGKTDAEMEEHLAAAFPYFEKLLNHLYGYFPNATFMWQRAWGPEIGRVSGSTTYTKESRDRYSQGLQRIQDYMTNVWDLDKPYDLIQVNCGAAWDEARALNDALETKLIPEVGGLCARLGVVNTGTYPPGEGYTNPGDGYHEGDIGGGQLLNAYVWYMTIMQTLDSNYIPDVSESEYVPIYGGGRFELSGEFVELLKNAAMSVFETAE